MTLWTTFFAGTALGAPGLLDESVAPAFPDGFVGKTHEVCAVEMLSHEDGRMKVMGVTGCPPPFVAAVETRLSWWTWRRVDLVPEDLLDPSFVLLTGTAGIPEGLYTRFLVTFDREKEGEDGHVGFVPQPVVALKKKGKVVVPPDLRPELPTPCDLLVHVNESGHPVRVQSTSCSEKVRSTLELPLMGWVFDDLRLEGDHPAYAVRVRVAAD